MHDDEKVSVHLRKIENGYLVERSWCEKKKGKNGMDYDYKNETYHMNSLPKMLEKMFAKGSNMSNFGGKKPSGKDDFEDATDNYKNSGGSKKSHNNDDMDGEY